MANNLKSGSDNDLFLQTNNLDRLKFDSNKNIFINQNDNEILTNSISVNGNIKVGNLANTSIQSQGIDLKQNSSIEFKDENNNVYSSINVNQDNINNTSEFDFILNNNVNMKINSNGSVQRPNISFMRLNGNYAAGVQITTPLYLLTGTYYQLQDNYGNGFRWDSANGRVYVNESGFYHVMHRLYQFTDNTNGNAIYATYGLLKGVNNNPQTAGQLLAGTFTINDHDGLFVFSSEIYLDKGEFIFPMISQSQAFSYEYLYMGYGHTEFSIVRIG